MLPARVQLLLLLGITFLHTGAASCFFAPEVQGEFVMQSSVTAEWQVQYSRVNITGESIPIWGICHKRIGNNVILMDDSGGGNCFRCFHLSLHSINVLQVRTEGLDKCYTSEDAAVQTCPGTSRTSTNLQEILLYKTKQISGEEISQEFCPISGRYTFTYNLNEGTEDRAECPDPMSELDNCPRGSELNLKFRRCSFENHDIKFQCLGHWSGPGRQKYLALLDTRSDGGRRAQYRCALYEEDPRTGVIRMAFSSDSTCTSDLSSATRGFETMVLNPSPKTRWPYPVETSNCRFPRWAQGHWENLHVNGNQLTYRDQKTFHVSSVHCVGTNMGDSSEKFGIYTRNQCGEDRYSCMLMKKRANNVVELKMSQLSSDHFNDTLCIDSAFDQTGSSWQTQGRIDIMQESPCPISGEYLGMIPDIDGLCAKLYSDCNNPEIMFFTVFDCSMPTDVFEARQPVRIHSRWRRQQQQQQQQPRRIFHISNPRPLTSSTPPPSSSTTTEPTTITTPPVPTLQSDVDPFHERFSDETPPPLPYNIDFPHQPQNNPPPPPPLPPEHYDNSGFARPDFGYNYQPRQYGGYGFSRFDHLHPQPPPQQPPVVFSDEVYDPWAFPKTHGNLSRPSWQTPPPRPPPPSTTPPPPPLTRAPQRINPPPTKREEREYRCLGQWEENGFTYTYTQRKDIGNSYECFVGLIVNKDEIFIKEAGSHCTRFKDITVHGMRLQKRGEAITCHPRTTTPYPPRVPSLRPVNPTTSWYSSRQPPTPTKPWKPITAPPRDRVASGVSSAGPAALLLCAGVVLLRVLRGSPSC